MFTNHVGSSRLELTGLYYLAFLAEDALETSRLSPFSRTLKDLKPDQSEDTQPTIRDLRLKTEAIWDIEAWTNQERSSPFCGGIRGQKRGRTRTKIQRYRGIGCRKTYSGRTAFRKTLKKNKTDVASAVVSREAASCG